MNDANEQLRRLPSVEILTSHPALRAAAEAFSKPLLVDAAREILDGVRAAVVGGGEVPPDNELIGLITALLPVKFGENLQHVINATGVLVHTNLGRAPLADEAVTPPGYSNLEFDLPAGKRGKRGRLVDAMIARLAGAEGALVVNNNAAAVYLVLTSLAAGKEVIISRGELVQIGGGFRIPDILERSSAKLKEVGATNKTTPDDYRNAINENTALILKVHRSNFKMTGFVAEAGLADLAPIAKEHNLPLVMDLGSGAVSDVRPYGLPKEPMMADCIRDGAELVTASGDKLFGGPQAGMIAGKKDLVEKLRSDPFYRALRPDKTTLAALAYTARAHLDGTAEQQLPMYRMLAFGLDKLRIRAEAMMKTLYEADVSCRVIQTGAKVGGGSLPEEEFPSVGLEITSEMKAGELAAKLRANNPPIIGMIVEDRFRLDLRTVTPEQDATITMALANAHA